MIYDIHATYSYKSTSDEWYKIHANSEEEAQQKVINEIKFCMDDTDELLNYEILEIKNITPLYFLITLNLSDNNVLQFILKINDKKDFDDKIQQRIKKQLDRYNEMYKADVAVVNTNIKKLTSEEVNLFKMCIE